MKKIHKERFIKLYEYMKQPQEKLFHNEFNFSSYFCESDYGTCGCMAGELSTIFPEYWKFIETSQYPFPYPYMPSAKYEVNSYTSANDRVMNSIKSFFGIAKSEAEHLFMPRAQKDIIDPYYNNHKVLSSKATKRQVVQNLYRFLKIKGVIL